MSAPAHHHLNRANGVYRSRSMIATTIDGNGAAGPAACPSVTSRTITGGAGCGPPAMRPGPPVEVAAGQPGEAVLVDGRADVGAAEEDQRVGRVDGVAEQRRPERAGVVGRLFGDLARPPPTEVGPEARCPSEGSALTRIGAAQHHCHARLCSDHGRTGASHWHSRPASGQAAGSSGAGSHGPRTAKSSVVSTGLGR